MLPLFLRLLNIPLLSCASSFFLSIVPFYSLTAMSIFHHKIPSFHLTSLLILDPICLFLFMTNLLKCVVFIFLSHIAIFLEILCSAPIHSPQWLFTVKKKENILVPTCLSLSASFHTVGYFFFSL